MAIDKLDKIGESGGIKELGDRGVSNEAVEKIKPLFGIVGSNEELLAKMRIMLVDSPIGLKGLEELTFVIDQINKLSLVKAKLSIDLTLARGLNYYTGAIFEVKANGVDIGSICGGGRYDDLTGIFGLKDLSGVGVSFGADRIYDVLNELDLFGAAVEETTQVLFINFGNSEAMHCLGLLKELRAAGINAELYPTDAKLKKQMNYAHVKGVRFAVMVGTNEIESGIIRVKDMATGDQRDTSIQALINMLNK